MATAPKAAKGVPPAFTESLGESGLRQTGGFVYEDFLTELRGERGAKVYRQMADSDEIVGAVLFAITMLIRNVEWEPQPVDDSPEAEDAAAFLRDVLDDMDTPMADVMDEVCTMFTHGYAPMEIVWKRRDAESRKGKPADNLIGVRSIRLRSQLSIMGWVFDEDDPDIVTHVRQQAMNKRVGGWIDIPMGRILLFRTTTARSNPEGRSILRNAYRSWKFKTRIQEIEGIGVERDLAGLPVAYVPAHILSPSASAEDKAQKAAWEALVQNVRRDAAEGILLPSARDQSGNLIYEMRLLSTGGTRTFDTSKIIDRYDRGIATSVLADFIFLGQQAVGSFALSSDKTALFASALGGFLKSIAAVLNERIVRSLWQYNGLDDELRPTLVPGDLEKANLAELGTFLTSMSGAGAMLFPDRDLENYLRKQGGMPPAPEEADGMDPRYAGMPGDPNDPNDPSMGGEPGMPGGPNGPNGPNGGQAPPTPQEAPSD